MKLGSSIWRLLTETTTEQRQDLTRPSYIISSLANTYEEFFVPRPFVHGHILLHI